MTTGHWRELHIIFVITSIMKLFQAYAALFWKLVRFQRLDGFVGCWNHSYGVEHVHSNLQIQSEPTRETTCIITSEKNLIRNKMMASLWWLSQLGNNTIENKGGERKKGRWCENHYHRVKCENALNPKTKTYQLKGVKKEGMKSRGLLL